MLLGLMLTCSGCATLGTRIPDKTAETVHPEQVAESDAVQPEAALPAEKKSAAPEPLPVPPKQVRTTDAAVTVDTPPKPVSRPDKWRRKAVTENRELYDPSAGMPRAKAAAKGDGLVLNFDQADLHDVVRTIADMLGINYLIDKPISGRVTIQTAEKIPPSELFGVFVQILEANKLALVRDGELYRIVQAKSATRMPLSARLGRGTLKGEAKRGFMIQLIPLKYVSPQEMTKLITPFASETGSLIAHEGSRTLVVVDTWHSIQKILKLVSVFDVDVFQNLNYKFYPLAAAEAEETAKILAKIYAMEGVKTAAIQFIPITRINTILVLGGNADHFRLVDTLVKELDQNLGRTEPRIYVYSVKNGEASELSDLLTNVFTKNSKAEKKTSKRAAADPPKKAGGDAAKPKLFPKEKKARKTQQVGGGNISSISGASTLKGEIRITPDTIRNVLIVEATPSDYKIVERILNRIDVMPRQVLIEVIIADIRLDDASNLGVEWEYDSESKDGDGIITAKVGEAGVTYKIGISDNLDADLSAFAQNKQVNILSSPKLLASDNKEAKINVSTEIPVASSEYRYDKDNSDVLETNIQYRDTGVILSVTPHINERGMVSMDISQEVSDSAGSVMVAGKSYPSFSSRNVSTTLTVKDGQTIVIGGMMSDSDEVSDLGVPFLSRIPFFGFFFGKNSRTTAKTELIILIRPKVIVNLDDVDDVTREFSDRVGTVFPKSVTPLSTGGASTAETP